MEKNIPNQSRRNFLKNTIVTGTFLPLMHENLFSMHNATPPDRLKIYIFSKHLQFLDYKDMAEAAADMGFDGVDLAVRPNGHVLPERVNDDLPKAAEAIRKVGFKPLLMTTAVDDAGDAVDKNVLSVASKLGFKYYRMNWFNYPEGLSIPEGIEELGQKVKALGDLNKQLGLVGYYQNHSGTSVGASIWELWELLKNADKQYMGAQYDIRHAVVEGGLSWENSLKLIQPRIKSLTIKDFIWEKKDGVWGVQDTPIGQGMVDFKKYFKLLKQYNVDVPVSLHIEYPAGGVEHGNTKLTVDKNQVFNSMRKDLQKVHQLWQDA